MALAVDTKHGAVGIDDGNRIEERLAGPLEPADRQHNLQGPGEHLKPLERAALLERRGEAEVLCMLVDAEIRRLEQLLDLDDLRAPCGGRPNQRFGPIDVGGSVPCAGHLHTGDGYLAAPIVRCVGGHLGVPRDSY